LITVTSLISTSYSQTIYATEFEEFTEGPDQLVGDSFWELGNSLDTGSHGIDNELVSGLGHSAFVGFKQPDTSNVFVAKRHDFDPIASGQPEVEFESFLGVNDSTNGKRDFFSIFFFNGLGTPLASIQFRNLDSVFGIWYSDGLAIHDTGLDFIRGDLDFLTAQINFETNTWSAQFGGLDLFSNVPFHAGGAALDLGLTGIQWQVDPASTPSSPSNFGDNYLLVADWLLHSVPVDDFRISSLSVTGTTDTITFPSEVGFAYKLEASEDLENWNIPLSNDEIIPTSPSETSAFEVTSSASKRFYRVLRSFAPPATE